MRAPLVVADELSASANAVFAHANPNAHAAPSPSARRAPRDAVWKWKWKWKCASGSMDLSLFSSTFISFFSFPFFTFVFFSSAFYFLFFFLQAAQFRDPSLHRCISLGHEPLPFCRVPLACRLSQPPPAFSHLVFPLFLSLVRFFNRASQGRRRSPQAAKALFYRVKPRRRASFPTCLVCTAVIYTTSVNRLAIRGVARSASTTSRNPCLVSGSRGDTCYSNNSPTPTLSFARGKVKYPKL